MAGTAEMLDPPSRAANLSQATIALLEIWMDFHSRSPDTSGGGRPIAVVLADSWESARPGGSQAVVEDRQQGRSRGPSAPRTTLGPADGFVVLSTRPNPIRPSLRARGMAVDTLLRTSARPVWGLR